jgi:hypothetical protein
MARSLVERLDGLGLLAGTPVLPPGQATLAMLCSEGALAGGLSVALDVRPDELVGPLCQRLGGAALRLRVLDSRHTPPELKIRVEGAELAWKVQEVEALATELNRCYRHSPDVRAIAWLGEWDDARQLWCLPRAALPSLLRQGILQAEQLPGLED